MEDRSKETRQRFCVNALLKIWLERIRKVQGFGNSMAYALYFFSAKTNTLLLHRPTAFEALLQGFPFGLPSPTKDKQRAPLWLSEVKPAAVTQIRLTLIRNKPFFDKS